MTDRAKPGVTPLTADLPCGHAFIGGSHCKSRDLAWHDGSKGKHAYVPWERRKGELRHPRFRAALASGTGGPGLDVEPDPERTGMPKCPTCGDIAFRPDPVTTRRQAWRCGGCQYVLGRCQCVRPANDKGADPTPESTDD